MGLRSLLPGDGASSLRERYGASGGLRFARAQLSVEFQNTALMIFPFYKGAVSRRQVVGELIAIYRGGRHDVVGLCEVFNDTEKRRIARELAAQYPHVVAGPEPNGVLKRRSGGLMLLSKHRIVRSATSVFDPCASEDCLAAKGIVFALVSMSNHMMANVFVTHTQNVNTTLPDIPTSAKQARDRQFSHLRLFQSAVRSEEWPTYVIGDLNVDGQKALGAATLMGRSGMSVDLWTLYHPGERGITSDRARSFTSDDDRRSPDDPARHRRGTRLDYILGEWAHTDVVPGFASTDIVLHQVRPGFDLSDHYAIAATADTALWRDPEPGPIRDVSMRLTAIAALKQTGDVIGPDSDELELAFAVTTATGARFETRRTEAKSITGTVVENLIVDDRRINLDDPGAFVDIQVTAFEQDLLSGEDKIGPGTKRLARAVLKRWQGHPGRDVHVLLEGSGGQYVASVFVVVR